MTHTSTRGNPFYKKRSFAVEPVATAFILYSVGPKNKARGGLDPTTKKRHLGSGAGWPPPILFPCAPVSRSAGIFFLDFWIFKCGLEKKVGGG